MLSTPSAARVLAAAAIVLGLAAPPAAAAEPTVKNVLTTYADIAQAGYEDALGTAKTLKLAVDAFLAQPTDANLRAARAAWIAARQPYMQTEAFRFGNKIVDDWEGGMNSWPQDEGLIDYVSDAYKNDSSENQLYAADVIANPSLTIAGKTIDASKITKELLADKLQEAGSSTSTPKLGLPSPA